MRVQSSFASFLSASLLSYGAFAQAPATPPANKAPEQAPVAATPAVIEAPANPSLTRETIDLVDEIREIFTSLADAEQ